MAPLPDEPEVVDGDEEMEQDEQAAPETRAATAPQEDTQPLSPKPQLLLGTSNDAAIDNTMDVLDASLNPLSTEGGKAGEEGIELDLSGLGPDGLPHDLSQVDGADSLVVGPLMDQSDNPFVKP